MKKKYFIISVIVVAFIITIIGVRLLIIKSKTKNDLMLQNSSIPEIISTPEITTFPEITSTPEVTIFPERTALPENMHKKLQNANDIVIEKNIYTDNDETINKKVSITYPSFTLPGVDMSFINDSIKKFIFDTFGDVEYEENTKFLNMEIDYEIGIANHKIISVVIKGYFMKSSMPHPFDLYQSLNFDVQNSKQLFLGEHYNIDDTFVDIFVNDSKTQLREIGIREGYEEPLFETLFEDVNEKFYNIDDGYAAKFCSYFTENHLVIIEQTIFAIGSHIETSIDYNEIESYLKPTSFLYNGFSL